jgi:hypothetical protein
MTRALPVAKRLFDATFFVSMAQRSRRSLPFSINTIVGVQFASAIGPIVRRHDRRVMKTASCNTSTSTTITSPVKSAACYVTDATMLSVSSETTPIARRQPPHTWRGSSHETTPGLWQMWCTQSSRIRRQTSLYALPERMGSTILSPGQGTTD